MIASGVDQFVRGGRGCDWTVTAEAGLFSASKLVVTSNRFVLTLRRGAESRRAFAATLVRVLHVHG